VAARRCSCPVPREPRPLVQSHCNTLSFFSFFFPPASHGPELFAARPFFFFFLRVGLPFFVSPACADAFFFPASSSFFVGWAFCRVPSPAGSDLSRVFKRLHLWAHHRRIRNYKVWLLLMCSLETRSCSSHFCFFFGSFDWVVVCVSMKHAESTLSMFPRHRRPSPFLPVCCISLSKRRNRCPAAFQRCFSSQVSLLAFGPHLCLDVFVLVISFFFFLCFFLCFFLRLLPVFFWGLQEIEFSLVFLPCFLSRSP
jgi:hypothetical protein